MKKPVSVPCQPKLALLVAAQDRIHLALTSLNSERFVASANAKLLLHCSCSLQRALCLPPEWRDTAIFFLLVHRERGKVY